MVTLCNASLLYEGFPESHLFPCPFRLHLQAEQALGGFRESLEAEKIDTCGVLASGGTLSRTAVTHSQTSPGDVMWTTQSKASTLLSFVNFFFFSF